MRIDDAKKIFDQIYKEIDGYKISREAQKKLPYFSNAHIYGEITFVDFVEILTRTKPQPDEIFYDLGSGTGKAVITASLTFPFSRCIGIEKLKELYDVSEQVKQTSALKNIDFIISDFNDYDFSNGDILYLNSYYFQYQMTNPVFIRKMKALKSGTRLIFVHTPLALPFFELIHQWLYTFTWGKATVYIAKKV